MARDRWTRGSSVAVAIIAGVLLFALVNYFGAKYWTRWDWTTGGLYTLSGQTRHVLESLQRDVRIVSFLTEGNRVSPDVVEEIRTLLTAYQGVNPARIDIEWVDWQRDPLRAQKLLSELGIDPLHDSLDVIVVESGERRRQVRLDEMVEFDPSAGMGGPPPVRAITAEGALTAAILAVTRQEKPRVLFATGHGELPLRDVRGGGLSRLADALEKTDVQVEEWKALGAEKVPDGTDLVVVAGPRSPWLAAERKALVDFLAHGGRVLLLLDPVFERAGGGRFVSTGLEELLTGWGLEAHDDVVIDPDHGLPFFGPETFWEEPIPLHPVTSALSGRPVLFLLCRSLGKRDDLPAGVVLHDLVETSANAWGETDPFSAGGARRDDRDRSGPLLLAVAGERRPVETPERAAGAAGDEDNGGQGGKKEGDPGASPGGDPKPAGGEKGGPSVPGARLIVVGDADMFSNAGIDQASNRAFALNAIDWLLAENRQLGIPPKERTLARLFLTEEQLWTLFAIVVIGLPGLGIGAGLLTWWLRRR